MATAPRVIAAGRDWRLHEFVCDAGPGDPTFEERHDQPTIAFVAAGRFSYHGATGRALLSPGQLLLGNAGTCYACGHSHGRGDRCLSLTLAPGSFDEIATSRAVPRFRFPVAALAAPTAVTVGFVRAEAGLIADWDTWIAALTTAVVSALGATIAPVRLTGTLERRIGRALARIEANPTAPHTVDDLAAEAALSKFHFLRAFHAVTGRTPHRYLIARRLATAARRLAADDSDVATVALDCGFTDLSGFHRQFRAAFGTTPARFRNQTVR